MATDARHVDILNRSSEKMSSPKKPKKSRYFGEDISSDGKKSSEAMVVASEMVEKPEVSETEEASLKMKKKSQKDSLKYNPYGGSSTENRKKHKRSKTEKDPYPGPAPVPVEKRKKYKRGHKMQTNNFSTKFHSKQFKQQEKKIKGVSIQSARTEILLPEESGGIEVEEDFQTNRLTQSDIADNVDIMNAQKFFDLKLDKFGPYRMNYTRNGRHLLIGGAKGHVAAMDWQTKKLMCEINVMETIQDAKWLHIESYLAVAQKQWTYIYDNQGIELHCLKNMDQVLRLEFLPYHFLLVGASARSFLFYIDVCIGQKVATFPTGHGRLDVMCQNPHNAVIHLGHTGGTVTLWSPNIKEPLAKMLCHKSGTRSIAVNNTGTYMATSGIDRKLKIWDLRNYKELQCYRLSAGANHLSFSQKDVVAAGIGNIVEVYDDCIRRPVTSPYLTHSWRGTVNNLQFCPYEDVLGVGHREGFTSLLVPGSGEPNFDALEANPFQTKKQRQHAEVKMLLEKIQPEMISLDPTALGKVDVKTLKQEMEERAKNLWLKPKKVDFAPRYKKKGKSKAGKVEQRKQGVQFEHKRQQIQDHAKQKMVESKKSKEEAKAAPYNAFDRFKKSD